MKRIILPGTGTPVTFCVPEDSYIGVRTAGNLYQVALKANEVTRIEFAQSLNMSAVAA